VRLVAAALVLTLLPGCYLSHGRPGTPGEIDAGLDAPRGDAPTPDVPRRDAPAPAACERLAVVATATLEHPDALGSVTPRLTALDDGEAGLVYVHSDGDPVRVIYERIGPDLESLTGPVTVSRSSFTWSEIVRVNRQLFVAYGEAGDAVSVLVPITERGEPSPAMRLPLRHPTVLLARASSVRWVSFDPDTTNTIAISAVSLDGELLSGPVPIVTGLYGSGHAMVGLPGAVLSIIGYPREGPPGVRRGYVRLVDVDGSLGEERQLSSTDVRSVRFVDMGPELIIISNGDELRIERFSATRLETLDVVTLPPIGATYVTGSVGDHVVIVDLSGASMRAMVLSRDLRLEHELTAPLPASNGPGVSAASVDDGLVVVSQRTAGAESFPYLMRIGCE
jgi:hypothetical protein